MKNIVDVLLSFILFCLSTHIASGVLRCYLYSLSPAIVPIGYTGQNVSIIVECDIDDLSIVSSSFKDNSYVVVCISIFSCILTCSCIFDYQVYRYPMSYYFTCPIIHSPYWIFLHFL